MRSFLGKKVERLEKNSGPSVVCFGDSLTRAMVSASYIRLLERRLGGRGFRFINAGVNGDHATNLLRRIQKVIDLRPDYVVILVGTNDINADVTDSLYWISAGLKGIRCKPCAEEYRAAVTAIVGRLQTETGARIALVSPPLMGEDLDSEANQRARVYSAVLKEIAASTGVTYLPLHETQEGELRRLGISHGGEYRFSVMRSIELVLFHNILGESYESISRRRGFQLVTDGIHMNERGAEIIANVIEPFLNGKTGGAGPSEKNGISQPG